jgi:hypothetical protein
MECYHESCEGRCGVADKQYERHDADTRNMGVANPPLQTGDCAERRKQGAFVTGTIP